MEEKDKSTHKTIGHFEKDIKNLGELFDPTLEHIKHLLYRQELVPATTDVASDYQILEVSPEIAIKHGRKEA